MVVREQERAGVDMQGFRSDAQGVRRLGRLHNIEHNDEECEEYSFSLLFHRRPFPAHARTRPPWGGFSLRMVGGFGMFIRTITSFSKHPGGALSLSLPR